jgi:hypothetical protein
MGGRFPSSAEEGEFNLAIYPEATAYVLGHWPTPVTFSGVELGAKVKTGARLIREHDPAKSPVARAYLEYTGGKDRESWDQTAALYAVRGLGRYFSEGGRGRNRFELLVAGPVAGKPQFSRNTWAADPAGDQSYLVEAMPPAELARAIEDLMMQPPAALSGQR